MKIKELLSDKSKWTQKAYARDIHGDALGHGSSQFAVSWCLVGAMEKCYPDFNVVDDIVSKIHRKVGGPAIFNDSHTFEEVKQLVEELDI